MSVLMLMSLFPSKVPAASPLRLGSMIAVLSSGESWFRNLKGELEKSIMNFWGGIF